MHHDPNIMAGPSEEAEKLGHEPLEVNVRAVVIAGVVLVLTILFSLLLIAGLTAILTREDGGVATVRAPEAPNEPPPGVAEVDANQAGTLRRLRTRETALLDSYGWVDQQQGVAHIPIAQAMQIIAGEQTPVPE